VETTSPPSLSLVSLWLSKEAVIRRMRLTGFGLFLPQSRLRMRADRLRCQGVEVLVKTKLCSPVLSTSNEIECREFFLVDALVLDSDEQALRTPNIPLSHGDVRSRASNVAAVGADRMLGGISIR